MTDTISNATIASSADDPLILHHDDIDPYLDPCPNWCDAIHGAESNDEDRNHYGERLVIPIRHETFEYVSPSADGDRSYYVRAAVAVYLHRNTLHRDPTIWLGKGETNVGFDLTLDEAKQIGTALLKLAGAGQ